MDEIDDEIQANAEGPAEVSSEAGTVKQHSLPDQIAYDRYRLARSAASTRRRGLRFNTLVPPGTTELDTE